jgi:hypothetical protein
MARRSKRGSNPAKRLAKIDQDSRPKIVRLKLDAKALSRTIAGRGAILPTLPNMQDNLVTQKLATESIGSLPLDHFGQLLCKDNAPLGENHILDLRLALIRVYFAAANVRLNARASQGQLKSAQAGLTSLTNAINQLDQVRPPRQRGLHAVFGSPVDDPKGLDELNDFGSKCLQVGMDIVPVMMVLSRAIENEKTKYKPGTAGERKKRLRTLVEALANFMLVPRQKPHDTQSQLRMLSNFQLGSQGLLQSFLIGQPEFRNLLHGVHMQQLRQRVIAACHVGALDAEETRAYIEHRLKHVGWKGDPQLEPEAYQTVFEVSEGIPRRINAVCDRLLLCGFLGEKHQFRKADVLEVAEEFEEETQGAKSVATAATAAGRDGALAEVEVLRQQLAPEAADDVHRIVSNISHDDVAGRLVNLEGSLLRLERNMLRLQNSTAASVTLLGQLIERLRTTTPRRESGSK